MRSRLYPHKDAIADALAAGTSVRNLARTYGVHHAVMQRFIGRYVPAFATRAERDRIFQQRVYETLRHTRKQVERSQSAAEEGLL